MWYMISSNLYHPDNIISPSCTCTKILQDMIAITNFKTVTNNAIESKEPILLPTEVPMISLANSLFSYTFFRTKKDTLNNQTDFWDFRLFVTLPYLSWFQHSKKGMDGRLPHHCQNNGTVPLFWVLLLSTGFVRREFFSKFVKHDKIKNVSTNTNKTKMISSVPSFGTSDAPSSGSSPVSPNYRDQLNWVPPCSPR
jgi:hypothetical protein